MTNFNDLMVNTSCPAHKTHTAMRSFCFHFAITIFLFVTILFRATASFAQQPAFRHFNKENGLPSDNIYDVLLDSQGYIWFSTDLGISKFDGISFQNYSMADGLPDNEIFSLFLDSQGRIWFGTYNGTPGYYHDGDFYSQNNCAALRNINNRNYISAICESPHGKIFIGSRDGNLHRINFDGPAELILSEPVSSMAAVFFRQKDVLEISSSSCEVISWNHNKPTYHVLHPLQYPVVGEIMVTTALRSGSMVMGYGPKISVANKQYFCKNYVNPKLVQDRAHILKIIDFGLNQVMICTSKGAYLFNGEDFSDPNPRRFLPGIQVSSAMRDNEGGVWFATKAGVFYAPNLSIYQENLSNYTSSTEITTFSLISGNQLLIGYDDGTIVLKNKITGDERAFKRSSQRGYSNKPNRIIPRENGRFWVSTNNHLELGDIKSGTLRPAIYGKGSDFSINQSENHLCFCHSFGWLEFNEHDLVEHAIDGKTFVAADQTSFERCYSTYYDAMNYLWVATSNHLLKVCEKDTVDFKNIMKALGGIRITSIAGDNESNIWLGTAGAGLIWISTNQAMPMNPMGSVGPTNITRISPIRQGLLGVATDSGFYLVHYSKFGKPYLWSSAIGFLDGFPSDVVSDFFVFDSLLWVATNKGYSSIPLGSIDKWLIFPDVKIKSLSIRGNNSFANQSNSIIPYDHQGINISFVGVSFRSMGHFEYKYRLEGLEDDWHFTDACQVEYPFLEPGVYKFQVYSKNHQGNWSISPAELFFTVATPFWKAIWFRAILILSVFAFVLSVFYFIFRNEKRKLHLKQMVYDAEQRALIGQMNPHFIFNSLNSIQSYFMNNDLDHANEFLSEFSELIRTTLNNSRKSTVTLADEILELSRYMSLEALRLEYRFTFLIECGYDVDPTVWRIPTMLIQPFVENAIWHGITPLKNRSGNIILRFQLSETNLRFELEDNGIGRVKSAEIRRFSQETRKSHAMNIADERIALINGASDSPTISLQTMDVYDSTGECNGTKIIIIFGHNYYSIQ